MTTAKTGNKTANVSVKICCLCFCRVATKYEKKFPEFSRLFQSHNYTFPEVIATKSIRNNDLHISRVIPHLLLLMWLTKACCPILLKSTVFVHQIHLAAHGLLDTGCTHSAVSFLWGCTEFPENSMSFPCSEKSLSIPGFPGLWPPCSVNGYT